MNVSQRSTDRDETGSTEEASEPHKAAPLR